MERVSSIFSIENIEHTPEDKIPMNVRKLYQKFSNEDSFLIICDELEPMQIAVNEMANHFEMKVMSLDVHACGESLFEVRDTFDYTDLPYWAKNMQENLEEKYILVFEHFEESSPRMCNWIKRLAENKKYDGRNIGEFIVAALYVRQNPKDDVKKSLGSAVCSPFKPFIEWDCEQ